jgi:hypothetical protein
MWERSEQAVKHLRQDVARNIMITAKQKHYDHLQKVVVVVQRGGIPDAIVR